MKKSDQVVLCLTFKDVFVYKELQMKHMKYLKKSGQVVF